MKMKAGTKAEAETGIDDFSPRFNTSGTVLSTFHHTARHFSLPLSLTPSYPVSFTLIFKLFPNLTACFHYNHLMSKLYQMQSVNSAILLTKSVETGHLSCSSHFKHL